MTTLRTYRATVYGEVPRDKRGPVLVNDEAVLLPGGLPDAILGGTPAAPVFELRAEPTATGARHLTTTQHGILAADFPVDSDPVVPVQLAEVDRLERRKVALVEALRATPQPPAALFPGDSYDHSVPFARALANHGHRRLGLPRAVVLELARPCIKISDDAFLAIEDEVGARGWGAPGELGQKLDEAHDAAIAQEKASDEARQRNYIESITPISCTGLVTIRCLSPRSKGSIAGQIFPSMPHGLPPELAYIGPHGGVTFPEPNDEIDGCPAWTFDPGPLGSAIYFPHDVGPWVSSKTPRFMTRSARATLPKLPHDLARKALEALRIAGLIDLRPLGEADLVGLDSIEGESALNALSERLAELAPSWGRGALVDVQSPAGFARWFAISEAASTFLPDLAAKAIHDAYAAHWARRTPGTTSQGVMSAGSFEDWPLSDIFAKCVAAAGGNRMHSPGAFLAGDVALTFIEKAKAKLTGPDPWQAVLLRAVDGKPHVRQAELYAALGVAGHEVTDNPINRKRLFAVMNSIGFAKREATIDGKRCKAWVREEGQ